jgi:hypothetical protein
MIPLMENLSQCWIQNVGLVALTERRHRRWAFCPETWRLDAGKRHGSSCQSKASHFFFLRSFKAIAIYKWLVFPIACEVLKIDWSTGTENDVTLCTADLLMEGGGAGLRFAQISPFCKRVEP